MYTLTHPQHGETVVYTELALQRHLAGGWQLKTEENRQPKRRKVKTHDDSE